MFLPPKNEKNKTIFLQMLGIFKTRNSFKRLVQIKFNCKNINKQGRKTTFFK